MDAQMTEVRISTFSPLKVLGTRFAAKRIREAIECLLGGRQPVVVDFTGVDVTQSFIDELIGPIFLRKGSAALEQLCFKGCSANAQSVISFVITNRIADWERSRNSNGATIDVRIQA
jgi:hypothetical protein